MIERNRADLVHRTHQRHFPFPIQIGEVQEFELAEGEHQSHHALVFRSGGSLLLGVGAERVGRASALDGLG